MQSEDFRQHGLLFFPPHNRIQEAVLQKKLRALKSFRQLFADRLCDHPRSRKADQGFRLREDDVAEHGEARRNAAHRRIGQDGDKHLPRFMELPQRTRGFRHLHE